MIRNWYAVDILAEYEASEAIESAFNELGALGTEIDGLRKKKDESLMVTGFFDEVLDDESIRSSVDDSLGIYGFEPDAVKSIAHRTVEETDWLAEWKKHWRPTTIGKFVIAPPWSEVDNPERIVIRVEPNMAFGTGTHETTQLCLKAISERYDASMSVLDVGTGTGILAIATAKLGGSNILACDTDLDSVKIARENARLNNVGEQIEFFVDSIEAATPQFDFVCANLTIDVIEPLLDLLLAKTKHTLLLSGVLAEQEPQIRAALQQFQISDQKFEIERAGEWISVIVDTAGH